MLGHVREREQHERVVEIVQQAPALGDFRLQRGVRLARGDEEPELGLVNLGRVLHGEQVHGMLDGDLDGPVLLEPVIHGDGDQRAPVALDGLIANARLAPGDERQEQREERGRATCHRAWLGEARLAVGFGGDARGSERKPRNMSSWQDCSRGI